ncbi:MAG: tetratricopeptide repeat protein, partial [Magnetococcales bacterium]|nr:tetratricopeptide repeat protein [Magnetococcales bacterium]
LGLGLLDINRPDAALAAFQQALALDASLPGLHFEMGRALTALDRKAEAAAAFKTALTLTPDHREARDWLDRLEQGRGEEPQPEETARPGIGADSQPGFPGR